MLTISPAFFFLPDKQLFRREDVKDGQPRPRVLSLDFDDPGELLMTAESDETIQIYNVRDGVHNKTLLSKKYGVKLAKFTHTSSSIIYASTKQNGMCSRPLLPFFPCLRLLGSASMHRGMPLSREQKTRDTKGSHSLTTCAKRCYPIPRHPRQLLHPIFRRPRRPRHLPFDAPGP